MPLDLHNPFEECDLVDLVDATPTSAQLLTAHHIVIVALNQLGHERVLASFQPLQGRDDRARAFAHLAYHLLGMVNAGARLEEPETVQALAGVARSVFEIVLDIALLERNAVADAVEKFHEFTRVERFRAAQSLVNVYKQQGWDLVEVADQHRFSTDPNRATAVEVLVERLWGRRRNGSLNWPRHWCGRDAAGRAQLLGEGWIKLNCRLADLLAWQIHGGPAGTAGLDVAGMNGLLVTVREVFADHVPIAFRALAREFGFATDCFDYDLRFVEKRLATVVVLDLKRRELGYGSRLHELGLPV